MRLDSTIQIQSGEEGIYKKEIFTEKTNPSRMDSPFTVGCIKISRHLVYTNGLLTSIVNITAQVTLVSDIRSLQTRERDKCSQLNMFGYLVAPRKSVSPGSHLGNEAATMAASGEY